MKLRPPKELPYRVALVVWRDAHSDAGWVAPEDIDPDDVTIQTAAFVIGNHLKRDHLTVAQDVSPNGHLNGVSHIPLGMVRAVHYIT